MLALRYDDPTGEMELLGDRVALEGIGGRIKDGPFGVVHLSSSGNPSPYSRFFSKIEVRNEPGKVSLTIAPDRETLVIAGGQNERDILAENIRTLAQDGATGDHLHIEYFEGHYYLSEETEPLVVSVV